MVRIRLESKGQKCDGSNDFGAVFTAFDASVGAGRYMDMRAVGFEGPRCRDPSADGLKLGSSEMGNAKGAARQIAYCGPNIISKTSLVPW